MKEFRGSLAHVLDEGRGRGRHRAEAEAQAEAPDDPADHHADGAEAGDEDVTGGADRDRAPMDVARRSEN